MDTEEDPPKLQRPVLESFQYHAFPVLGYFYGLNDTEGTEDGSHMDEDEISPTASKEIGVIYSLPTNGSVLRLSDVPEELPLDKPWRWGLSSWPDPVWRQPVVRTYKGQVQSEGSPTIILSDGSIVDVSDGLLLFQLEGDKAARDKSPISQIDRDTMVTLFYPTDEGTGIYSGTAKVQVLEGDREGSFDTISIQSRGQDKPDVLRVKRDEKDVFTNHGEDGSLTEFTNPGVDAQTTAGHLLVVRRWLPVTDKSKIEQTETKVLDLTTSQAHLTGESLIEPEGHSLPLSGTGQTYTHPVKLEFATVDGRTVIKGSKPDTPTVPRKDMPPNNAWHMLGKGFYPEQAFSSLIGQVHSSQHQIVHKTPSDLPLQGGTICLPYERGVIPRENGIQKIPEDFQGARFQGPVWMFVPAETWTSRTTGKPTRLEVADAAIRLRGSSLSECTFKFPDSTEGQSPEVSGDEAVQIDWEKGGFTFIQPFTTQTITFHGVDTTMTDGSQVVNATHYVPDDLNASILALSIHASMTNAPEGEPGSESGGRVPSHSSS